MARVRFVAEYIENTAEISLTRPLNGLASASLWAGLRLFKGISHNRRDNRCRPELDQYADQAHIGASLQRILRRSVFEN